MSTSKRDWEFDPKNRKSSFEEAYNLCFSDVYRFVYSRCGNKQVSEDVTEETFIVFWEIMDKYNGKSKLKNYIIGIALNKLRQHYQNQKLKTVTYDDQYMNEVILDDYSEEEDSPKASKVSLEVKEILKKLPERYREILKLRFIENKTTEEIGKIMKINKDNVRKLQSRALRKASQIKS